MAKSWSLRWQALQQRCSNFIKRILAALGEAEVSIQREQVLKQIGNEKDSADF